jgi:hypothetical protein
MCTTGAKLLEPGHEFLLFKNRDFTRAHYEDRVRCDGRVFGALGLETWDGDDPDSDRFSGFSIGCNALLACCDSNVRMLSGAESYDVLVEQVVEQCTTVDEAAALVAGLIHKHRFAWGNLIVATPQEIAAFEVRDRHLEVARGQAWVARTNHHVCLGATPEDDDTTTSAPRYAVADAGLSAVEQVSEIFPLLREHIPDPQHSICNHGIYDTVYSYAIHWRDGAITLYVHQGHPCDGAAYVELPLIFGSAPSDLRAYPSNRVD